MKQYDVVALGEILIDFAPIGTSELGLPIYQQSPGGAPANMLCACAKFGLSAAFLGKAGNDGFGHFLKQTLIENGLDASGMLLSDTQNTTLAFVHLSPDGDRSFSFYRDRTADVMLTAAEVDFEKLDHTRVFHFGSLSLTVEPCRGATLAALDRAKAAGCMISYDPNLRASLWDNLAHAKEVMLSVMHYADLLKISEEELVFLTGLEDFEAGARALMAQYDIKLVLVTLGADGSMAIYQDLTVRLPAYPVKVADTTGAGDSFTGGFLFKLLTVTDGLDNLTENTLRTCLAFGNATGSLTTTKKGGICALPSLDEVTELINYSNLINERD